MKENKVCIKCGAPLVVGRNITQYRMEHTQYVCRKCASEYVREKRYQSGYCQAMGENKKCSLFLGIHVAEQALAMAFKNVQWMPINNPGFDFKCGNGYLVDVKCACRSHSIKRADYWVFHIKKNQIAEYFLCLAFDDRENLNPEHIWLIRTGDINDKISVGISETRLDKWSKYEQPIDRVIACCNTMKT